MNGGFSTLTQSLIPNMAKVQSITDIQDDNESAEAILSQINPYTKPLPSKDPFEEVNASFVKYLFKYLVHPKR